MLLLHRRAARYALVAVAAALYALFSVSYSRVAAWLPDHPVLGRIFFFEFAPWPGISLVWIGLILNNHWITRGVTNLLCLGAVSSLLGLAYYLVEIKRLPVGWLVVLGRTSLMLSDQEHRGPTAATRLGAEPLLISGRTH